MFIKHKTEILNQKHIKKRKRNQSINKGLECFDRAEDDLVPTRH